MKLKGTKVVKQFVVSEEASTAVRILALQRGKKVPEILREIVEEYVAREAGRKGKAR
jgi:hypothetical protein